MFSCEYCKIFKNTYIKEDLRTAASNFSVTASKAVAQNTSQNTSGGCFCSFNFKLIKAMFYLKHGTIIRI